MNYLVQLFHDRQENTDDGGAKAALNIDEELAAVHATKNISITGGQESLLLFHINLTELTLFYSSRHIQMLSAKCFS